MKHQFARLDTIARIDDDAIHCWQRGRARRSERRWRAQDKRSWVNG